MTPIEIQQLLDDISLERSILSSALDVRGVLVEGSIDLRGPRTVITNSVVSSFDEQAIAAFVDRIMMPVLFGSAWKILDLVIERAWQSNGGKARPSIEAKVLHVVTTWNSELTPLFDGDAEIAERVACVYQATKQLRHSLVHRRLLKRPSGEIETSSGHSLSPEELDAFCRFALRLADCIEFGFCARSRSDLAWWLNRQSRLHGLAPLSDAYAPRPIDVVLVNAWRENELWFVDTERAYARTQSANSGFPYANLRIFAPNDEFQPVEVALEGTPRGNRTRIDPIGDPLWP